MSDRAEGDNPQIRVVAASKRFGAESERGCPIAVKWQEDGESKVGWLDDFLEENLDDVEVPEEGLGIELRPEYPRDDNDQ